MQIDVSFGDTVKAEYCEPRANASPLIYASGLDRPLLLGGLATGRLDHQGDDLGRLKLLGRVVKDVQQGAQGGRVRGDRNVCAGIARESAVASSGNIVARLRLASLVEGRESVGEESSQPLFAVLDSLSLVYTDHSQYVRLRKRGRVDIAITWLPPRVGLAKVFFKFALVEPRHQVVLRVDETL